MSNDSSSDSLFPYLKDEEASWLHETLLRVLKDWESQSASTALETWLEQTLVQTCNLSPTDACQSAAHIIRIFADCDQARFELDAAYRQGTRPWHWFREAMSPFTQSLGPEAYGQFIQSILSTVENEYPAYHNFVQSMTPPEEWDRDQPGKLSESLGFLLSANSPHWLPEHYQALPPIWDDRICTALATNQTQDLKYILAAALVQGFRWHRLPTLGMQSEKDAAILSWLVWKLLPLRRKEEDLTRAHDASPDSGSLRTSLPLIRLHLSMGRTNIAAHTVWLRQEMNTNRSDFEQITQFFISTPNTLLEYADMIFMSEEGRAVSKGNEDESIDFTEEETLMDLSSEELDQYIDEQLQMIEEDSPVSVSPDDLQPLLSAMQKKLHSWQNKATEETDIVWLQRQIHEISPQETNAAHTSGQQILQWISELDQLLTQYKTSFDKPDFREWKYSQLLSLARRTGESALRQALAALSTSEEPLSADELSSSDGSLTDAIHAFCISLSEVPLIASNHQSLSEDPPTFCNEAIIHKIATHQDTGLKLWTLAGLIYCAAREKTPAFRGIPLLHLTALAWFLITFAEADILPHTIMQEQFKELQTTTTEEALVIQACALEERRLACYQEALSLAAFWLLQHSNLPKDIPLLRQVLFQAAPCLCLFADTFFTWPGND